MMEVEDNMPRYAKANVTEAELKSKIEEMGGIYEAIYSIANDLKKIDFDFENVTDFSDGEGFIMPGYDGGYEILSSGVQVCWCGAGGDWEIPVAFCVYIGSNGKLRGYVPTSGNVYNKKFKSAYGNNEDYIEVDDSEETGTLEDGTVVNLTYDMDAMRKAATNRLKPV